MRPGQNKRMRGRNNNNNNNRKGPNPLTRSYESNGPDVKIRGTAHHIGEKYLQLARDAQSSGDPVMAESYLQHAEHYFRLIAAAQQAQQQAQFGYQRPAGEPIDQDEDNDDDFESLPDRFASPSERVPPPQNHPQPNGGAPYQANGDRPPYEPRQNQGDRPYDRGSAPQPSFPDRQSSGERQDRPYDNRNNRGDRGGNYQERSGSQDRNVGHQDRGPQPQDRPRDQDRQRDYDNRNFRNNRGQRDFRDGGGPPRPAGDEAPTGLPAFITGAARPGPSDEPQPNVPEATAPAEAMEDDANFHMRPRRRRRPRPEFANGGETDGQHQAPATDPVGE